MIYTMDSSSANKNEVTEKKRESETEYENMLETAFHPMSEGMYNMLSSVGGFIEKNGATYTDYVAAWKVRYGKTLSDAST